MAKNVNIIKENNLNLTNKSIEELLALRKELKQKAEIFNVLQLVKKIALN